MRELYRFRALGLSLAFFTVVLSYTSHAATDFESSSVELMQQKQTITGVVVDENGQPMAGVVVQVDGTNQGAITDQNGAYSIKNVSTSSNLIFSFFGYKTFTSPAEQPILNVKMDVDALSMEEVVVVGFGSQKKVNLTGSVAVAGEEVFKDRPVANATAALQGAVPGLNISSNGGGMDETSSITIRGQGTIGTGSSGEPLVLIDGMEGDINSLNPQDIESVSVLKDAASSSIYGSRAPFGVILITTKKGDAGKMRVNYNNSFRYATQLSNPDMMNSLEFALYHNQSAINNNGGGLFTEELELLRIREYISGERTTTMVVSDSNSNLWNNGQNKTNGNENWYDLIYKDWSFSQEHNITLSGGTEKQQIYASFNYLDQTGFCSYVPDKYARFSSNIRATGEINDYLRYNYNVKFQRVENSEAIAFDNLSLSKLPWPTMPVYDPNGYYADNPANQLLNEGTKSNRNDKIYQQLQVIASPLKNWNITGEMNINITGQRYHEDEQQSYVYTVDEQPYLTDSNMVSSVYELSKTSQYINPNIYSDYTFDIKDTHNFKVMVGFQSESYSINSFSAKRDGLLVPYMDVIDVTTGLDNSGSASTVPVTGSVDNWATAGFFGRINYDYKEKYLFEANLRYDGTSRFSADNRWAWFPSFSAGWNIAKEEFFENMSNKITTLKLRASYGELGNQNTTNLYPTYSEMTTGMGDGGVLVNGVLPNTAYAADLLNSSLTWETVKTTNVGVDVSALKNRLNVSFDYFVRNTTDMVGPAPELPNTLGTSVPLENNTDMRTNGWELNVTWRDRFENGFSYNVGFNLADYQSTITSYPNENNVLGLGSTWTSAITGISTLYTTGQKVGEIWGLTTIDIARSDEEMLQHLATLPNGGQTLISGGSVASDWQAGDIMYADLDGDGVISTGNMTTDNPGDLSIIGNTTPRYQFGINLGAEYKGFDISAFFSGVMKRDYAMFHSSFFGTGFGNWGNAYLTNHLDYFRDDVTAQDAELGLNIDSYYPRPLNSNKKNMQVQTKYLQDASYIRLKNLQVGYTFSQEIASKVGFSNLRIFASGENLWTGTALSDIFDPETIDGSNSSYGIAYPLQSVISFGLNVTF